MIQWIIIIALLLIAAAQAYMLQTKLNEAAKLARERELAKRAREEELAKIAKDNRQVDEMVTRMREQRDTAQAYARSLAAKRDLAWPKPEGRMAPAAVIAEFNVDMKDGLWGAVMQELDDAIGEQLDVVTQPPSAQLTAEVRTHAGGMAEGLRVFQRRLLDLQRKATAAEADDENEKDV